MDQVDRWTTPVSEMFVPIDHAATVEPQQAHFTMVKVLGVLRHVWHSVDVAFLVAVDHGGDVGCAWRVRGSDPDTVTAFASQLRGCLEDLAPWLGVGDPVSA